jgi:acetyl-CoA acetyltransferase
VSFAGCSPSTDLLLGTTHSLARLKKSRSLDLEQADVVELYEGFGGEVLAQLAAMRCPRYAREVLGMDACVGDIDLGRVNRWGGTIGLGHPFGATGIRLLLHAVGRLEEEEGRMAVVAGCAGGGLGAAFSVNRL